MKRFNDADRWERGPSGAEAAAADLMSVTIKHSSTGGQGLDGMDLISLSENPVRMRERAIDDDDTVHSECHWWSGDRHA